MIYTKTVKEYYSKEEGGVNMKGDWLMKYGGGVRKMFVCVFKNREEENITIQIKSEMENK